MKQIGEVKNPSGYALLAMEVVCEVGFQDILLIWLCWLK